MSRMLKIAVVSVMMVASGAIATAPASATPCSNSNKTNTWHWCGTYRDWYACISDGMASGHPFLCPEQDLGYGLTVWY